jgi:hypothetical protein
MRALATVLAALALAVVFSSASASAGAAPRTTVTLAIENSERPHPVALSKTPPAGRRLSAEEVKAIADRLPKIFTLRAQNRGSFGKVYLKRASRWQVSYFSRTGKEIGLVIVSDRSGRVIEQWTGLQFAWPMARGDPGAFGEHVNALYVWLPLCVLFMLPFFDFRRPLRLLHLDLLMLLSFSVSLAFFNHAHIYASVPLAYPPLLYLLARMLALLRRGPTPPAGTDSLRLLVPTRWLALGVVLLLGFRIGLNVTDSNVIDGGYAGVIGAQRIADGKPLYGGYPSNDPRGDTYGPVNYEIYVPFEQILGSSGTGEGLAVVHAAAIFFDLLSTALLFLLGRRMRGPTLGVALAYAWVSYPFTLYALESNSNDSLVAAAVLAALLAASYRSTLATGARGMLAALAGLTKFAPLAIAPLLATHGLSDASPARRARSLGLYLIGFLAAAAVVSIPALSHDSLHEIYERTLVYQSNRNSPFSVWGLYGLQGPELIVEIAVVAFALALALVPRRADLVGLAAACAAVMIAVQLGIEFWFYLYIPWFFPLVILALFGRLSDPAQAQALAPSARRRSAHRRSLAPAALANARSRIGATGAQRD